MNARIILIALIVIACSYCACKKKDNVKPVVTPQKTDSTKKDSVMVSIYPYTDTFAGVVSVHYSRDFTPDYNNITSGYLFYVQHLNSDSFTLRSSVLISQGSSNPAIFLYFGYRINAMDLYKYNGSDSFYFSGDSLYVGWNDQTFECMKGVIATGGGYNSNSTGYFAGALMKH